MSLRRALLLLHRWLGLAAAIFALSSGLTGTALVLAKPADRLVNAHLHRAGAPLAASALDVAYARLRAEWPQAQLVLRLPRENGDSVKVDVRGAWEGEVFVHPASGAELGRRAHDEGFYNMLFEWHAELLAGESGKLLLLITAAAMLSVVVAGVVLWWPRGPAWRDAVRVRWHANATRLLLDLHMSAGALAAVVVLVSVASGAYMAWRPISGWVNAIAGVRAAPPPQARGVAGEPAPVSRLMAAAEAALPGGHITIVVMPSKADQAVRVRKRLPDEVHPNGLSSVWLHPRSAEAVRTLAWRDGDPGLIGYEYIYPLHIGSLGGPLHELAVALAGIALAALAATGAWIWWKRRPRPKRIAAARREEGIAAS